MTESKDEAYEDHLDCYRKFSYTQNANGLLQWDQYVTMPEVGRSYRSNQISALTALVRAEHAQRETMDRREAERAARQDTHDQE